MLRSFLLLFLALVLSTSDSFAQDQAYTPEDVATPEALAAATYRAISRAPGEHYDWSLMRALFLSEALFIPNREQTQGEFKVYDTEGFIERVDGFYKDNDFIGSANDKGFVERQVNAEVFHYGDIASVISTYEKNAWDDENVFGRGINIFQLVWHEDRWWVASIVWDEEVGAGPVPAEYMPE